MPEHPLIATMPPGTIGIPCSEQWRYAMFGMSLLGVQRPPGSIVSCQPGANVAGNLNEIIKQLHGDWLWLIGDDHTMPVDIIPRLWAHDVDIVAPLCLRRSPPYLTVISTPPNERGELGVLPLDKCQGLMNVYAVGTAGMLIKRRVLDGMEPPWFRLGQINPDLMSEDIEFCMRARKAGFDVWVDCDTTIGHIEPVVVQPVRDKATGEWRVGLDLGNRTIMELKVTPPKETA